MNTNSSKSQRVKEAVLHSPLLIPFYLKRKDYDNYKTKQILKQLIPFRVGVELECCGNLQESLLLDKIIKSNSIVPHRKSIIENYKIIDFSMDCEYEGMKEHKISFDYRCITGFYKILEDMNKYCTVNTLGGCHIHINNIYGDIFGDFMYIIDHSFKIHKINANLGRPTEILSERLSNFLSEIGKIVGGYDGTYNSRTFTIGNKGGWACLRNDKFQTYEFRIGQCNFDYEKIINWVIQYSSLVKQFNIILITTIKRYLKIYLKNQNSLDDETKRLILKNWSLIEKL